MQATAAPHAFTLAELWRVHPWAVAGAGVSLVVILVLLAMLARRQRLLKSTAQALQQAHQQWESLADHVPGVLYQYRLNKDGSSCFPYASRGMSDIYGVKPEQVRHDATPVFGALHPDDLARVGESIQASARTLTDWRDQYRVTLADGRTIWVEGESSPQAQPDGSILWHGYIRDISDRKRDEAELARHREHLEVLVAARTSALVEAKAAAEAASRAKSAFLANMSHELRTPMSGVLGMIDLATRRMTDPQGLDQLAKARLSAESLLRVLNDILDLSRIEAERMVFEDAPLQLGPTVDGVVRVLELKAAEKGLRLSVDLPAPLAGRPFSGDALRIGQILMNLVGNAIKFTERGGVTLRVREGSVSGSDGSTGGGTGGAPGTTELHFEVSDTGIGIAPEVQARLFRSFEQADNSMTRKYGGTGLGLSICKRLVTLMGGEIGVRSTPGAGSTFWFSLPLRHGDAPAAEPPPGSAAVAQAALTAEQQLRECCAGARVLLAEDEPITQIVTTELLQDLGLVVDLAEDGQQALALARRHRFALILMDMQMPQLNGLDASRAIRADSLNRDTPILAMTANAFDEDRQACTAAGMNGHLTKPVAAQTLYETLLAWLQARSSDDQRP